MNFFKRFFPHAYKATSLMSFIITMLVYVLVDAVCGFAIGFLSKIPIFGFLFTILGAAIGLYAFVGIVISILVFLRFIK